MNTANKLTMLRMVLIPLFIFFALWQAPYFDILAFATFLIASLTDYFDGYIARKRNMITDFGKFLDPLADKFLVVAAFTCMVADQSLSVWILFAVIMREFAVMGIRMVAASAGTVIAAGFFGKVKTVMQLIFILMVLFPVNLGLETVLGGITITNWLGILVAAVTVASGLEYIIANRSVLSDKE